MAQKDELVKTGLFTNQADAIIAGFVTGDGGAVTQITSRSTGVTLSKRCGTITTDTTSLAAGAEATFIVTNTLVAATDVPVVAVASGALATTIAFVSAVAAGQFSITLSNLHASTAETGALVINFLIKKSVAA